MENPFDVIITRLNAIESLLLRITTPSDGAQHTQVMDLDAVCEYTGFCKQTVYRKTSKGEMPHGKQAGRLYFDRAAIDAWLLSNQRGHRADVEQKANDYIKNASRRTR